MSLDRSLLFGLATSSRFERLVRATPLGERLASRAASPYVAGPAATSAFEQARKLHDRGVGSSIDQFGENLDDAGVAELVAGDYLDLAEQLTELPDDVWLSVDLSHLGLDVDPAACCEYLAAIASRLPVGRRIQVGAEDFDRADAVANCVVTAAETGVGDRLGATVPANLHRSPRDLERFVEAGVHVRLVKGAYVEPRSRALPYGEPTDVAYLRLAHRLAELDVPFALATHDGVLREALLAALGPRQVEQLLGVRPETLDELVGRGVPARVYLPYGEGWFRYWMRRVAESRGA